MSAKANEVMSATISDEMLLELLAQRAEANPQFKAVAVRTTAELASSKASPSLRTEVDLLGGMELALNELALLYRQVSRVSAYYLLNEEQKAEHKNLKGKKDPVSNQDQSFIYARALKGEVLAKTFTFRLAQEVERILNGYGYVGAEIERLASTIEG